MGGAQWSAGGEGEPWNNSALGWKEEYGLYCLLGRDRGELVGLQSLAFANVLTQVGLFLGNLKHTES